MSDYSKKKCVVCNRIGGITQQPDGLFACKNCGTPYRPRRKAPPLAPEPDAVTAEVAPADRFVWFDYTATNGVKRRGLYDCPRIPPEKVPHLTEDANKLAFLRYLHQHGRLGRTPEE